MINAIQWCDKEITKHESVYICVGADTGLAHMAAALEKKCITLYAFNKVYTRAIGYAPVLYEIRGVEHIDLIPEKWLDCCTDFCMAKHGHCINQISVDEVFYAVKQMMR